MSFNDKVKNEIIHQKFDYNQFQIVLSYYLYDNCFLDYDLLTKQPFMELSDYYQDWLLLIQKRLKADYNILSQLFLPPKPCGLAKLRIYDQKGYDFLNQLSIEATKRRFSKKNATLILIGTFLASGVICDIYKKIYHAEIAFKNLKHAQKIHRLLVGLKIDSKIYFFKHQLKIYVKRAEAISDLLKLINAVDMMMLLEEVRISNDFINQSVRLNNLDVANISKITKASIDQIKLIGELISRNLLKDLDRKTQIYAQIRLANPTISLHEIATIFVKDYNLKITKSGINHIVRKLKKQHAIWI